MKNLFIILSLVASVSLQAQRKGLREMADSREGGAKKNFLAALRQYRDKQSATAERILEENIRNHPDHASSVALLARIKTEDGDLKQAKSLIARAFKLAPN